jgi:hypothetical protein
MVIIFFDIKNIDHKEFVLAGQTVNPVHYCDDLQRLSKCAKTSPRTLVTKELAVASQQPILSNFLFYRGFSGQKQHDCHPSTTLLA